MSRHAPDAKPITAPAIRARKGREPVVCLTAYTAPMAGLLDAYADLLLVGDSLGMVVHGLTSTVGVTVEMMVLHGRAVVRGAKHALVVVDLPFGSYEESPQVAYRTASRIMMETGCGAVKLEGGEGMSSTIGFLVERGIPVMGHVGLRPQQVHVDGGFKAKGRGADERARILREAAAADRAGAFAIVVEGVAEDLAAEITGAVNAPTIGIGASAACDGQILVTEDMLGLFEWTPKFVRRYADMRALVDAAAAGYAADVRSRAFPGPAETYVLKR